MKKNSIITIDDCKKLTGLHINILFVVVGCAAVVVGVGVYIGVKKKYWFW